MLYSTAYESDLGDVNKRLKRNNYALGVVVPQRDVIARKYDEAVAAYPRPTRAQKDYIISLAEQLNQLNSQVGSYKSRIKDLKGDRTGYADKYNSITSVFTPYLSPDYGSKNSQAYLNFYQPQLIDQFGAAKKASMFQLANQGNLTGSASDNLFQGLQSLFSTSMSDINKRAEEYGSKSQSDVTKAVDSTYRQSPDAAVAKTTAQTAAAPFADYTKSNPLSPLADTFSSFLSGRGVAANSFQANAGNAFGGGGGGAGPTKPGLPGAPASITEILQRNNAGTSQQKVVR